MKRITLKNAQDRYFDQTWSLYKDAFPEFMRRPKQDQLKVMKHPLYHCHALLEGNEFVGFIFWWDFKNFRYVEYFAIGSNQRNTGRGKAILTEFMQETEKPIILEVELPHREIDQRRIKFYERIGFRLVDYNYVLPPMREGDEEMEFLLMTYPYVFSTEEVEDFVQNCHPIMLGAYN